MALQINSLPAMWTFQVGTDLRPGSRPCCTCESSRKWALCLDPCTHVGNQDGARGPRLTLCGHLGNLPVGGQFLSLPLSSHCNPAFQVNKSLLKILNRRLNISHGVFSVSSVVVKSAVIHCVFFPFLVIRINLSEISPSLKEKLFHIWKNNLTSFKVHFEWKLIKILWLCEKLS